MSTASRDDTRQRVMMIALGAGLIGAALCAVGLFVDREQAFRSWLWAYVYWWEVAIGCLGLGLLYQLVGGNWGYVTRPFHDAGIRSLPLLALLFVPVALGLGDIYPWAEEGYFEGRHHVENKQFWLSPAFFLGRAVFYFLSWIFFGWLVTRRSPRPDGLPLSAAEQRMGKPAGLGMALLALTASLAGIDWALTVDPWFHSTIYGGIHAMGGLLMGMALCTLCATWYFAHPNDPVTNPAAGVLNDLGNLLLAFLMVWTYFQFSQFLIIWSGNLPEEAAWYVRRMEGGWEPLGVALAVLHFVVPFFCLLLQDLKRTPRKLGWVAAWILLIHIPATYWTIVPGYDDYAADFGVSWLDPAALVAVGGLWAAGFAWLLKGRGRPVLPHTEQGH